MASSFKYICNNCDYSFITSGPHDFYRDKDGNREPYGHPVATSKEAAEAGVAGLYANVYCIKCHEVKDVVLIEGGRGFDVKPDLKYYQQINAIKCPDCGSSELLHGPKPDLTIRCQSCESGTIENDDRIEVIS